MASDAAPTPPVSRKGPRLELGTTTPEQVAAMVCPRCTGRRTEHAWHQERDQVSGYLHRAHCRHPCWVCEGTGWRWECWR